MSFISNQLKHQQPYPSETNIVFLLNLTSPILTCTKSMFCCLTFQIPVPKIGSLCRGRALCSLSLPLTSIFVHQLVPAIWGTGSHLTLRTRSWYTISFKFWAVYIWSMRWDFNNFCSCSCSRKPERCRD